MEAVRIGLVGSGFVSAIHAEALRRVPGAALVAVASPTPGHAGRFAAAHAIPHHFADDRALLVRRDIDLVVLGLPNGLHGEAGKHVVVAKPMALSLAECDRMIAACRRAGVMHGYAEDLCFAPKYVRFNNDGHGQAVHDAETLRRMPERGGHDRPP